ncbi:MAG TPA: carboxypeptidase regulatory-like domain-containing protein [Gemmatimonadaceae bacterium]|nr:carboxypeptidase regulatory-like domain-containing protein [Gemmatimonadaceae bacterium]
MMRPPLAVAFAALVLAAAPLRAQRQAGTQLVVGVADEATGQPLEGAILSLPDFQRWARTDAMGRARLPDVLQGNWTVEVRKFGYQPLRVTLVFSGRDSLEAVLMLTRTVGMLDTVRVTAESPVPARLQPFHRRRAQGLGRFQTRADLLTRWGDRRLADVAHLVLPGVRVEWNGFNAVLASSRVQSGPPAGRVPLGVQSSRVPSSGVPKGASGAVSCPLTVLVDDMPTAEGDIGWIHTSDIAGMEYFSGETAPPQYRRAGRCGVLLIWLHW